MSITWYCCFWYGTIFKNPSLWQRRNQEISCKLVVTVTWYHKEAVFLNGWMFGDFQPFSYVKIWFIIQLKQLHIINRWPSGSRNILGFASETTTLLFWNLLTNERSQKIIKKSSKASSFIFCILRGWLSCSVGSRRSCGKMSRCCCYSSATKTVYNRSQVRHPRHGSSYYVLMTYTWRAGYHVILYFA